MDKIKTIIFWGACWGILESTLGWLLHLVHFKGEALLLYPFGVLCMMMAFQQTGQLSVIIKVAAMAALIKLSNLLAVPAVPVFYVLNPAVAILLEGLGTMVFCGYLQKNHSFKKASVPFAVMLMFSTIVLFRGWQLLMSATGSYNPTANMPVDMQMILYWSFKAIIQGATLVSVYWLVKVHHLHFKPAKWINPLAFTLLLVAVLLNIM